MKRGWLVLAALGASLVCSAAALAQGRVDPYTSHTRIWAVVPRIGTGTQADPFRPKFFPTPGTTGTPQISVLGWAGVLSPDRTRYFLQVCARSRADVSALISDPTVVWLDKAVTPSAQVLTLLRTVHPSAFLERLRVRVP